MVVEDRLTLLNPFHQMLQQVQTVSVNDPKKIKYVRHQYGTFHFCFAYKRTEWYRSLV